jgi:surface antigen
MTSRVAFVAAIVWLSAALAGCSTTGGASLSGPGSAAKTGPAAPETIISAMGGGLIGGSLGSGLSAGDRELALQAEYRALEYTPAGKPVDWKGSRGAGAVTASQPYRVGSQDCRQYIQTVTVGAQSQSARGTACRNPDGSWTPLT